MTYILRFSKNALEDLELHKKSGNKKILGKLEILFSELMMHPKIGIGKPEKLKHNNEELYSRRIDRKHRLVYQIKEEIVTILILSAYQHYGDK